jgi:hypothetical protein
MKEASEDIFTNIELKHDREWEEINNDLESNLLLL